MVKPNVAANSNQEQFDLAQSLEVGNVVEFDTSEGAISGEVIKTVGENPKKIHIEGSEGKQYTLVPTASNQMRKMRHFGVHQKSTLDPKTCYKYEPERRSRPD